MQPQELNQRILHIRHAASLGMLSLVGRSMYSGSRVGVGHLRSQFPSKVSNLNSAAGVCQILWDVCSGGRDA